MNSQSGSVLVGVLAMSVVMAVAGASFIILSGNSNLDLDDSESDQILHNSAESAIFMGARWIRGHSQGYHNSTWADSIILTPGGYIKVDSAWTRVSIHGIPAGPALRILKCIATLGAHKDTLEIRWTLTACPNDPGHAIQCIPALSNWTETYRPGKP